MLDWENRIWQPTFNGQQKLWRTWKEEGVRSREDILGEGEEHFK